MAKRYVIDANATLGLFLRLPYSDRVDARMEAWRIEEPAVFVPTLWEYECASGLRRAAFLSMISQSEACEMMDRLVALDFRHIAPTPALHRSALEWSERIGQSRCYDSHYLALAEDLSADFWTADDRLFHALQGLGVGWAHAV